jgi:hypothetical protein
MDRSLLDLSLGLSIVARAVPTIILFCSYNRQPLYFKWLAALLLFSFCSDVVSVILIIIGISPNISSSLYWILSPGLVSIFFYYSIQWPRLRSLLVGINVIYLCFAFINFAFIQRVSVNSYSQIIQALIILLLSIIYFYKLLKELPAEQLQKLPLFWIVSGFFFSNAGKLVVYSVTHYLIHFAQDNLVIVWSFHNFLAIIADLLIAYGAWLNHKQLRSTSLSL